MPDRCTSRAPRAVTLLLVALAACSPAATPTDASTTDAPSAGDAPATTDAPADAPSDVAAPDAPADDANPADAAGAWGQPCTVGDDSTCASGLFCLQGPAGGTVGFCTRTCPATSSAQCTGTPAGTAAFCVVTDVDTAGDKGCAFTCLVHGTTYPCPGALTCETADDPPGSAQRLCVP